MPRQFRLSLSVTRVLCVKTAEHIEILSPSDRTIIFFVTKGRCVNLMASLQRGRQIQGGSNLRPICSYILERVIDRGIVTMEDEYKVVCALSNSAAFDDLE